VTTAKAPPATKEVDVRDSQVHLVDIDKDAKATDKSSPPNAQIAAQLGASTCLTVESDGRHWGFRNRCGYTVQFAYCTMDAGAQLSSCKDGAVAGSVPANGFGVLMADEGLKEANITHDFRWVACQGGTGEVVPRLDQTDPPTGRCVR